jgi:hypothetical protein
VALCPVPVLFRVRSMPGNASGDLRCRARIGRVGPVGEVVPPSPLAKLRILKPRFHDNQIRCKRKSVGRTCLRKLSHFVGDAPRVVGSLRERKLRMRNRHITGVAAVASPEKLVTIA